jgi:hypothetical protein
MITSKPTTPGGAIASRPFPSRGSRQACSVAVEKSSQPPWSWRCRKPRLRSPAKTGCGRLTIECFKCPPVTQKWPVWVWSPPARIYAPDKKTSPPEIEVAMEIYNLTEVQSAMAGGGYYGYGFNIIGLRGRPLVAFMYERMDEAEAAHELIAEAIAKAKLITPMP